MSEGSAKVTEIYRDDGKTVWHAHEGLRLQANSTKENLATQEEYRTPSTADKRFQR